MTDQAVSLREFIDARMNELDRRVSETTTEVRTIRDLVVPREYYDQRHAELETRVSQLEQWKANYQGRMIAFVIIGGMVVAIMSALVTDAFHG